MSVLRNKKLFVIASVLAILAGLNGPSMAYPGDPENSALLYYQAFLTIPQDKEPVATELRDYAAGKIPLNEGVEGYVRSCHSVIDLAATASQLADCDWGLQYSKGFDMLMPSLAQMRTLGRVLVADARIQASQGNDELAFERCITVMKMARHVGDDTLISFLVATAMENMAINCIGDLIGSKNIDSKLLASLDQELKSLGKNAPSVENSLELERQVVLDQLKMEKIGDLMRAIDPKKSEAEVLEEIKKYGGEAFLKKSRDYYSSYMKSVASVFQSKKSYAENHTQLTELAGRLKIQQEKNPEVMFTSAVAPGVSSIYGTMVRARTQSNALKTAMGLYLAKAKTGKLPDSLPAGALKDLFSGKGFEYKKSKAGFTLVCRQKDIDKKKNQEYEFKVAK